MAMTVRKVTRLVTGDAFDTHLGFYLARGAVNGYTYEQNGVTQTTTKLGIALSMATREAIKEGRACWLPVRNAIRLGEVAK
jgi:hypothetical protein